MTRLLTAILALVAPVAALAGAVDDAQVALERGEYAAALSILDNHVRENDEDAQGRFLRGLTLVLMDRDDEATQAFANLVRDYPDLPEPYNNLAVLYARAGKYELAMDALETALIKHPSYATAHENLGDVYATLAQAAWKRAQVLDRESGALEGKLSLISQALAGGVISADASPAVALDAPPPAREPVAAAPQSAAQQPAPGAATPPQGAAQPGPVDTAQERRALIPVPQMAPIIDGAPAAPATQPRAVRTPPPAASRDAALAALQGWAAAWSAQDANRYLASYSRDFQPGNGVSLDTWQQQRRARLAAPTSISVQVLNPQVQQLDANTLRVRFVQVYQSNAYADQVTKVIDLQREAGGWKIIAEDAEG